MEIKKSPKADLERGKSLSILMGFVVGLAVLFVGFEWSTRDVMVVQASEGVASPRKKWKSRDRRIRLLHLHHLQHQL